MNNINETKRIISFSVRPGDSSGIEEIDKLKDHCSRHGISFSHAIIKAIKKLNKELDI